MSSKSERSELLVGIFVLVGLVLLGAFLFQFGILGKPSEDTYPVQVVVRDASGIREGAPVRLGGVEIGSVSRDPQLGESFSDLLLDLEIFHGRRIPRNAEVRIGTSGLLGDSFVRITPPAGKVESFYEEGETIKAAGPHTVDDLATGAVATLDQAADVLSEIGESVKQLNGMFEKFETGVLRDENVENLTAILEKLRVSSERFEVATARLEPIFDQTEEAATGVKEAADKADVAFEEVGESVEGFNEAIGTVTPVVGELDETLDELRSTLSSLDGLVGKIEHGNGVAGALLNDAELRRDLTSFVDKLNRNGILRYPKEERESAARFPGRTSSSRPAPPVSKERSDGKKGLFPWLKKKE
jgi:phospholipid/cholesterol/gamma-HCH transport system substrate-binding protein